MAEYKAMKLKLFRQMDGGTLALLPTGFDDEGKAPEGAARFGLGVGCGFAFGLQASQADIAVNDEFAGRPVGC